MLTGSESSFLTLGGESQCKPGWVQLMGEIFSKTQDPEALTAAVKIFGVYLTHP